MDFRYIVIIFTAFSTSFASKLVLILMDGFRWDYYEHVNMPAFDNMLKNGVRAEYMVPDFPSLSYPNYYSIVTGLHCESHGMVGNFMYDEQSNKNFLIGGNPEQSDPVWWNGAEPIWVNAEKQGKRSYFYYWPGCEVSILGVNVTYCKRYEVVTLIPEFEFAIKETLQLLKNDSADLIGIYLEAPDKYGHKYGVSSTKLKEMLGDIDKSLQTFRANISSLGLEDDVNLMIFSDHGMTNITQVVNITDDIDLADVKVLLPGSTYISIWPEDGRTQKIYDALVAANRSGTRIHRRQDIPDRYHLKNSDKVAPIIVEAEHGVYILAKCKCSQCPCTKPPDLTTYSDSGTIKGMHGYDNAEPDMRSMFTASGPAFRKNYISKPIAATELYQIMCKILELTPKANNGTWDNVKDMMVFSASKATSVKFRFTQNLVIILGFISIYLYFRNI